MVAVSGRKNMIALDCRDCMNASKKSIGKTMDGKPLPKLWTCSIKSIGTCPVTYGRSLGCVYHMTEPLVKPV